MLVYSTVKELSEASKMLLATSKVTDKINGSFSSTQFISSILL